MGNLKDCPYLRAKNHTGCSYRLSSKWSRIFPFEDIWYIIYKVDDPDCPDFSMLILVLKLFLAPGLIAIATLAGKRWGPAASGWLIGFPIISAPINFILARQHGIDFAVNGAIGVLGGQVSMCLFCAAYIFAARKLPWWISAPLGIAAFSASALFWNNFTLPLLPTYAVLAAVILFFSFVIRPENIQLKPINAWWDLPARMITAMLFVTVVTTFSSRLGPEVSGLLSTFPVFGSILSTFTHAQQGGRAAGQLLRGTIVGSFGIANFYLVLGLLLPLTGSLWIYLAAAVVSLISNGIAWQFTRPRQAVLISAPK